MKQIAILTALIIFTSCASVESKRSVSASGDPSEIFFEKEIIPMDSNSNFVSQKPARRSFEEELSVEKYAKAQPPEKPILLEILTKLECLLGMAQSFTVNQRQAEKNLIKQN